MWKWEIYRANVCCVQFHPTIEHLICFGSADHQVYMYDLRQTKQALQILKSHRKAVSYIKFLNDSELVRTSQSCYYASNVHRLVLLQTIH